MLWLLFLLGGGAALVAVASSSSNSTAAKPPGGLLLVGTPSNPFGNASSYVDPLNEGSSKLKDAGEQAKAKSEAEGGKDFEGYAELVGGQEGKDYAHDIYGLGTWLANHLYGDEYEKAQTPFQKARLAADVGVILQKGFPPAGIVAHADFGQRDVAQRIEDMFDAMNAVATENDATDIGNAAKYAATNGTNDVKQRIKQIFDLYSQPDASDFHTSGGGTIWTSTNAPTYLIDPKDPSRPGLLGMGLPLAPGDRPELEYIAAAAAGLYGAPLADAIATVYGAANTYASRRGLVHREDFLPGYPDSSRTPGVDHARAEWLAKYGQADSMVDAWRALKLRYDVAYAAKKKDEAASIAGALAGLKSAPVHL